MKSIPLTRGLSALVDDDDFERVNQWQWQIAGLGYAGRNTRVNGRNRTVYLHRFIMNAPKGVRVDHKNRNPLDCRKENLRLATQRQNSQNRTKPRRNPKGQPCISMYKGVSWNKERRRWQAMITVQGKQQFLGYFTSEIDAAKAYDAAARKHFTDFAALNF